MAKITEEQREELKQQRKAARHKKLMSDAKDIARYMKRLADATNDEISKKYFLTRGRSLELLLKLSVEELHELIFDEDLISECPETSVELLRLKTHPDIPKPDNTGTTEEKVNKWKQWAKERNIGKK